MPKKSTNTSLLSSSSSYSIKKRVSQFEQQKEQSLTDDHMADSSEESFNANDHFINVAFERFKHEFIGLYPESMLPFDQLDSLNQARNLLDDQKNHIQKLSRELNRCKFTIKFLEEIINHHDKESKQHDHPRSNNIGKNNEISISDDTMMLNTSVDVTANPSSSQYVTVITLNDSAYGEIQKISPNKTSPTSSSSSSLVTAAVENNDVNDDGNGNAHHNEIEMDLQQHTAKTVPEPIYSNTLEAQKSTLDKAKKRPPTPPRKPKLPNKSMNSHSNNSINNIETSATSKPLSSSPNQQSQLTKSESLTTATTTTTKSKPSSSSHCNRSQFQRKFNGPLQRIEQKHEIDSNKINNKRFNKKSTPTNNQNKAPYMRTFSLESNIPSSPSTESNRNMIKRTDETELSDYNIYDTVAPDDSDSIEHDDDAINEKTNKNCDNRTNEHNLTSNDEEMETSSQEMLSRSSSTDELSNYVNIDYFLRKNSVGRSISNIPVSSRVSSTGNRKISSTGLNVEESENENENFSSIKSSSDYDNFGSSENILNQFQIPANSAAKRSLNSIGATNSTSSSSSLRLRNAKLLNKESNNIESNYSSNSIMSTFTPPPSMRDKEFNFSKHTTQTSNNSAQDTLSSEKDENSTYSDGSDFNLLMDGSSSSPLPKNIPSTSSPSTIALETDFYAFTDIINHENAAKTTTGTITDNFDSIDTSDDSLDRDVKSISTKFEHQGSLKSPVKNNINVENLIDENNKCMTINKSFTIESEQSQQMQWSIVRSIIDSETIYLDCLNTLNKYRKAFESASKSDNALISTEDIESIFYRIADLYDIHNAFLAGLKKVVHGFKLRHSPMMADSKVTAKFIGKQSIGELFNRLAEQLPVYADFLRNYSKAIETANRCSANNSRFFDIIKSIKLASAHVQFSNLVDMLHEPVARLQKNALVLHDLLKYTENEDDQQLLKNALRLNQKFFNDLNLDAARRLFMTHDKFKRRLVKESFIIESGDRRKLRHLFLFNDVIVSAKYKASSKQKFTFELRFFQMLSDIVLDSIPNLSNLTNSSESSHSFPVTQPQSSSSSSSSVQHTLNSSNNSNSNQSNQHELEKESKDLQTTANLISSLKSRAFSARLDLYIEEKRKGHTKQSDRLRKKISELESELSLYLPQLKFSFRVKNNPSKCYTFFLSSEYERNCWIDAIKTLQQNASSDEHANIHVLQKWIESCRKSINVNCGSFLLRSNKDETLRYGDLQMRLIDLANFHYHTDLFIVIETDSFGHYFKRAVARYLMSDFVQKQNRCQEFLIELEGSQIVRFLLYEKHSNHHQQQQQINDNNHKNDDENRYHQFKGKAIFELTASCTSSEPKMSEIQIGDYTLCFETRFIPWNSIMETIPPNKIYGSFGVSISQVCKKEKSTVPYLILSCILEVERRGLREVGIYRVSGLSSEVQKLKKAFETNPREACYLIRETDIHSVTGLLKLYLRELPESLFTNDMYQQYFEARDLKNPEEKEMKMTSLLAKLVEPNHSTVIKLIEHLVLVNHFEEDNKMSLNNLATVFGPTMLRTNSSSTTTSSSTSALGQTSSSSKNSIGGSSSAAASHQQMMGFSGNPNQITPNITPLMINTDLFTASTIDVMAQADILYFFLRRKADGYSLTSVDHQEETSL